MALKVAIVGLAADSHDAAPFDDPQWECWGLTWDGDWARFDRTFEMHDMQTLKRSYKDLPAYLQRVEDCPRPYMQEKYIECATRYPMEAVSSLCGDYFCSSVAYMLALAIHEGAQEIGLFGVNLEQGQEYAYQRPNVEYLIGFARGRGIKVQIHETSPLCKFVSDPDVAYVGRYGWLG